MDAAMKERITPMLGKNVQSFSDAATKNPTGAKEGEPKVDFKTLLQTSNADTSRERIAKNPNDLKNAKTEEEFYKVLSDRANPNSAAPKNKLDKDDFLKLFVAQLKNQDPLKPDDAAQMAAQLAQFNGLEQMMNVNKNLEQMTRLQENGQAVSLLDYVGKEVTIEGGRLMMDKGKLSDATYNIDQPTAGAELEVRDSAGIVVATRPLGVMQPGEHKIEWDGLTKDGEKTKDGLYTFAVVAQGLDGGPLPASIKSKVRITGVDMKDPGGSFFTEMGKISVNEISSVGVTGFDDRKLSAAKPKLPQDGTQAVTPLTPNKEEEKTPGTANGETQASAVPEAVNQMATPITVERAPSQPNIILPPSMTSAGNSPANPAKNSNATPIPTAMDDGSPRAREVAMNPT